jgi:hypothetical protein
MDYKIKPGEIHPGDILLFSGKGFISRGIRFFTKSKYSHTAIAVSGTECIEATSAGVEKSNIQSLVNKTEGFCVRRIESLTVKESEMIKEKAYQLLYEDYDFLQLISMAPYFLLRKIGITWNFLIFNSRTRMICSELVGVCLMYAGIIKVPNYYIKRYTPESWYTFKKAKTILEL